MEHALKSENGWQSIEDTLKLLPGNYFDAAQTSVDADGDPDAVSPLSASPGAVFSVPLFRDLDN